MNPENNKDDLHNRIESLKIYYEELKELRASK